MMMMMLKVMMRMVKLLVSQREDEEITCYLHGLRRLERDQLRLREIETELHQELVCLPRVNLDRDQNLH